MTLASVSAHLRYDRETRQFSRVTALEVDEHESTTLPLSSSSMCSAGNESVERGYVMVPESLQKWSVATHLQEGDPLDQDESGRGSWQRMSAPKTKNRPPTEHCVRIADPDVMASW
jgi:hypothetical protein